MYFKVSVNSIFDHFIIKGKKSNVTIANTIPINALKNKYPLKKLFKAFCFLKFFNLTNKRISDSLKDPMPKSGVHEVIVLVEINIPVLKIPKYLIDMPANNTEVNKLIN